MNTLQAQDLLQRLISRTIRRNEAKAHADRCIHFDEWQWHQGVALHGLMRAQAALGDPDSLSFVQAWVDRHLAAGNLPKSINTTAPLLAVVALAERTRDPKYREVCEEYARWCLEQVPRLADGNFEHSCTENRYPQQVWADTLFMGGIFLARWGILAGNDRYLREALTQFARHYQYLTDGCTGLIYHGYDGTTKLRTGVLWGRGNGWFTGASIAVLELLPIESPEHGALLANFQRHLDGVLATQDESGAWHTVMDDPSTYLEMSGTAAFAMGLQWASRRSWGEARHRAAADRAYAALAREISAEGELQRASGGTAVMPTAGHYNAVPYAVTGFAQGLAMLSLSQFLFSTDAANVTAFAAQT